MTDLEKQILLESLQRHADWLLDERQRELKLGRKEFRITRPARRKHHKDKME